MEMTVVGARPLHALATVLGGREEKHGARASCTCSEGEHENVERSSHRRQPRGGAHGPAPRWPLALAGRRSLAVVLATLLLAAVAIVFTPGGVARADTVFQSGQVFASVGNSDRQRVRLGHGESSQFSDRLYGRALYDGQRVRLEREPLRHRRHAGRLSASSRPSGAPLGQFATGLQNPELPRLRQLGQPLRRPADHPVHRRVLSRRGNAFPTSARWKPSCSVMTGSISSSDQCTFYYTSEGSDIMRYNKCTNTQESNFNQVPFSRAYGAFEVRILADGDVLVADSDAVRALGPRRQRHPDVLVRLAPGVPGPAVCVSASTRTAPHFGPADS